MTERCCFLLPSSIPGKSFAIGQGSSLMSPLGMGNIGVGTGREYSGNVLHINVGVGMRSEYGSGNIEIRTYLLTYVCR